MSNENEQKGAELRRQGKPKPRRIEVNWYTTKRDVQARDDVRIGYDREDAKRSARSKKK